MSAFFQTDKVLLAFSHASEAIAAVNRAIRLGLEGNLGFLATGGAGGGEELTGATGSLLAGVTAGLAALGLILEAALSVKLLLTGGEDKLCAALFANQFLVFEHFTSSLYFESLPFRAEILRQLSLNSPRS